MDRVAPAGNVFLFCLQSKPEHNSLTFRRVEREVGVERTPLEAPWGDYSQTTRPALGDYSQTTRGGFPAELCCLGGFPAWVGFLRICEGISLGESVKGFPLENL